MGSLLSLDRDYFTNFTICSFLFVHIIQGLSLSTASLVILLHFIVVICISSEFRYLFAELELSCNNTITTLKFNHIQRLYHHALYV